MEKELIKLLLNKKFYTKNKTKLSKEFFTNGTGDLYETIEHAHEDSDKDLSINEVSSLHMDVYNPATTRAKKEKIKSVSDTAARGTEEDDVDLSTWLSRVAR